jgi:hypothetical protein
LLFPPLLRAAKLALARDEQKLQHGHAAQKKRI